MSLPSSFQYFVSSMAGQFERTPIKVIPDGNVSPAMNSSLQVTFPSDAILDLDSLYMVATLKSSNAIDAGATIVVPNTSSLFRSVQWSLNGNVISGAGNQNWGQVYEALRRCSAGTDYARSRADEYQRVPICDSDGKFQGSEALTVAGHRIHIQDFGALQRSPNASAFDTSVYGTLRLHLHLAGSNILMCLENTGVTQTLGWELASVEFRVDTLKAPQVYDELIMARLQEGGTIDTCFPDIVSQISASDANVRFNVSAQSLNYLGWCPLPSEYNLPTRLDATALAVAAADSVYGPYYTSYKLQNTGNNIPTVDSTAETYFWNVNGKILPAHGANPCIDGVMATKDTFCGKDVNGQNLLFAGLRQPDGTVGRFVTYRRENFLEENCIIVHKTCIDEAHANAQRMMTGINSSGNNAQIQLNTVGLSTTDYILLFAATTTVLSASAGQQVAVTY